MMEQLRPQLRARMRDHRSPGCRQAWSAIRASSLPLAVKHCASALLLRYRYWL